MLIRLGFLVAASIAAFTVKQITIKYSKPPSSSAKTSDIVDENFKYCNGEERKKYILQDSKYSLEKETVEDVPNILRNHYQLTNSMQKMPSEKPSEERSELECLRSLVNEMEETQENLSTNLLVCYGFKEQEMEIVELKDHLNEKRIEINKLSFTKNYLKAESKKLQEEITQGVVIKKQLEKARIKIRDLEQKIEMNANQRNGILTMLNDQVESIQTDPNPGGDADIQKKLNAWTDLQLEAMELHRRHKELQLEKRILAIKVVVAEARIASVLNTTESEVVRRIRIEGDASWLTNENLLKQVEELQKDRFNVVEELVYQRWVNACLRYEIQNHQMPFRKKHSTCQVKPVSYPCSPTESNDSYNRLEVRSRSEKRRSLIHKLKRWRRNLDNFSVASSLSRSFRSSSKETPSSESTRSRRSSFSVSSFGGSTLRNIRNRVSFTAVRDKSARGSPETENIPIRRRRVSFNDALNTSVTLPDRTSSLVGILDNKYLTDVDCEKIVFEIEKPVEESGSDLLSISKTEIEETIEGVSNITDATPRILKSDDTTLNPVQLDLGLLRFDATFVVVVIVVFLLYILYLNVSVF
ncbi:hypothetical protein ACHQM5_009145 [Ranunculus cassubicifolius]